jgi:hypothetical protein
MSNIVNTVNIENKETVYVIKIDISKAVLPSDYTTLFNILFCRRFRDNECDIRKLTNNLAKQTRVKRTFTDSENIKDDSNETFLIYFRFDQVQLPRFTSELISVYKEKLDKLEYKRLNKSKYYYLIGIFKIQKLSVPEQFYILHQIESYLNKKIPLGVVELCR